MSLKFRILILIALLPLVVLFGCRKNSYPSLALEECDPGGYIPCIQQSAFVSIPITDTNLFLTYSSQWAQKQGAWDTTPLGLGGWSINLVQRYDRSSRVLVGGDGSWRITDAVTLPSGESAVPSFDGTLAYIFDSAGRHVRTVDAHLGTDLVKFGYDSAGRLATVAGSVAGRPVRISIQRDANGRARTLAGVDSGITTVGINDQGQLTSITDPAGATTLIGWNPAGLVESETDPAGSISRFAYDSSGELSSTTDADGVVRRLDRSTGAGRVEIRVSTALGRRWSYRSEFQGDGIRRTFTAPDGTVNTETIAGDGARKIELADGTKFEIGAVASPIWKMASPILSRVVESRPDGVTSRREMKYAVQSQRGLPYMLEGTVTTTINGQSWIQNFDPAQRTATLADPLGLRTIVTYDENGRVLSYSAPGTAPVSYAYNAEGRRISETVGAGNLARITRYSYDANTGLETVTRPDGVVETTAVDKSGRTVSFTAGDGSTVLAGYDAAGRVNQIQPPGGLNFTLGASPAGRATAFVPPMVGGEGSVETRSYDDDGNLNTISGLGKRSVAFGYDSAGRVTSSTFGQGKRSVSYDSHSGLVTQASDPSGVTTSYGFTGGAKTSLRWSGPVAGSVTVVLDANGRAIRESVNAGNNLDFTYDRAGNLTGVGPLSLTRDISSGLVTNTKLGIVETKQEFDANNELARATTTAAGKLVLDLLYTRDALGRIKTIQETTAEGKSTRAEYSYDRAGRLAAVRVNARAIEMDSYDPAGNRTRVVRGSQRLEAAYDDRDRITRLGTTRYAWMPDGTLTGLAQGDRATAFVYDDFGALREAALPDGRKISYLVDADGRRVGRTIAGKLVTGYLYRPDGSLAAEVDPAGKVISRFGYDDLGHLATVERGGAIYRVITDAVGSPRVIVDSRTGAVVEQIAYDAWGDVEQDSAPGFIPIGFAGGLRDADTGLVRFGARDYDPASGRWVGGDPIRFAGGQPNLYAYTNDDPINRTDPTGLNTAYMGGVTLGFSGIGGIGPSYGLNIQYIQGAGLNVYGYGGGGVGSDIGLSLTGNVGMINNPGSHPEHDWEGPTDSINFGGGPFAGGLYKSPGSGTSGGPSYGGISGGLGLSPSPFLSISGQRTYSICITCPSSSGDTHIFTASNVHFDFQAAGEFIAGMSRDGRFAIQARQEPIFGGTEITFNSAVAANVNGDRVGVYAKEPSFLMVNGLPWNDADLEKRLPHGGKLQRHGATVNIFWPDGTQLNVTRLANTLNYGINPSPNADVSFIGLLGGSQKTDDLKARDGSILSRSDPAFQAKLYSQVGNSWRIKQSESLFHYWPGESTATFTNLNIPSKEMRPNSLAPDTRSKAEQICRAAGVHNQPLLDDCILDVGVTGMPAFVSASIGIGTNPMPSHSAVPAVASSSPSSAPPAADHYSISIGDTISPDHPFPGAGTINKAGEKQTYSFDAQAGANVYVTVGPCNGAAPSFELRQADEKIIDGKIGCGDFGPVALPAAGTYRIVAAADGLSAHYTFTLRPTSFEHYSIKIGDTVSPDHPAPGAGVIKNLGQKQSYSFPGRAGEAVYLRIGPCEGAQPSLSFLQPDNGVLDGIIGNCSDIGRVELPVNGTYRIVAETGNANVFSRYGFSLFPIPPDQHFTVRIPVTVSQDFPERGTGRINTQGAQQFYDFTTASGSTVHIEGKCNKPCPNLEVRATSLRDKGRIGFLRLEHLNFDWKLPDGGKYTIQVRSTGYVGDYSFSASLAQPQRR